MRGENLNKKDNKKNIIIEALLVTLFMAIYIVYGIQFLPLLILLIPMPFIVLGVRNNWYSNIVSIILTLLIVEIIIGNTIGASLIFIFAPLSIGMNYCIENRKSSKQTILISSLCFLIPLVIMMILGIRIANIDLITEMEHGFSQYMSMQIDGLKEMGLTNHEVLKIADVIESGYNGILMLIPSFIFIFSIIIAYINYFFTGVVLRKMGYELIKRPRFSRFKLPSNILLGVGVMLISAFILKWLDFQYNEALLANITFLAGITFMLQGLAVLDFFLKRMKIKFIFRVILIVLNLVFLPIGSLIILLGVIDSAFDIRKLRRPKS